MIKKLLLLTIWFCFTLGTCNKETINTTTEPTGEWILSGIFLSDAKDTPCGWAINDHREITIKFEKNTKGTFKISGNSVVNSYGGNVESIIYSDADKRGKIKFSNIFSTEIGASKELMQCEERYYDMLKTAEDYSFDESGNLLLGRLKKADSHPRDGGTYLIFVKK